MLRRYLFTLLTVMVLLFVTACGGGTPTDTDNDQNANEDVTEESADGGAGPDETEYPLTVVDVTGTEITIEKEPERIVSTSTSDTEILFALGLGDKIYGVSDFDNYPEEAKDKPKMGGVVEPNVEAILEQEPDLVVTGNSISEEAAQNIRDLGITLYQTDPKNMEEVFDVIRETGLITNRQKEAEDVIEEMQSVIDHVKETVAEVAEEDKKKVYIEYNPGWTVGKGEFMHELIELAGGINVAGDTEGWIEVNEEKIIEENPDVIIYAADLVDEETGKQLGELIKERDGWEEITAIEEDQMVPIDEDIMSRNGPRIVEALQQIAEGIYPELFD
ncbi:MAG TPA: ABC transporter substrate-binding protein [Pseudogracilibacillus sp.]|nr:ABC transporter substrate-binding protein [Pseudogracilibacillus sp.]